MLYHLGLRGGELLNIRIRDIDFGKNQLVIARRADEKDDPRSFQPLVKTLDRKLPLKDTLAQEIHNYIIYERKKVPNSKKNDFLFITHKSGPTQGLPLSKSGYKKIIEIIRNTSPSLFNLTGHQLRHTWNEIFSKHMDSRNESPTEEQQEKMRSYLMGWKENSGSAAHYNKRFIKRKAIEASLQLQEGLTRIPQGINNPELRTSKRGYLFNPQHNSWVLDKDTRVVVETVTILLAPSIKDGYIKTLTHYAITMSSGYVKNINQHFSFSSCNIL